MVGVVSDGRCLLDCRTLTDAEAEEVAAAVAPRARSERALARSGLWDLLRGALATRALAIVGRPRRRRRARGGPRPRRRARARGRRRRGHARPHPARARERRRLRRGRSRASSGTPPRRSCCARDGWDDFAHLFGGRLAPGRRRASTRAASRRSRAASEPASGRGSPPPGGAGRVRPRDGAGLAGAGSSGSTSVELARRRDRRRRRRRQRLAARRAARTEPGLRGIVFDLPGDRPRRGALRRPDEFVGGSFFERVPERRRLRPLDRSCTTGTTSGPGDPARRPRRGAGTERGSCCSRRWSSPATSRDGAKWLDLLMLALFAGRERTEAQWRALLETAGFEPVRIGGGADRGGSVPLTVGTAGHIDHGKTWLVRGADRKGHRPAARGAASAGSRSTSATRRSSCRTARGSRSSTSPATSASCATWSRARPASTSSCS